MAKSSRKEEDILEKRDAGSVALGNEADRADLGDAREKTSEDPKGKGSWLRKLGPGLVTGAADDDPSGIGTYSVAGARFGYHLLFLAPLCVPLMIAVQEMCGRVGLVTCKGLAAILKEHYSKWLLYGAVALLALANTINVYADLNVMAASLKMVFGLPFALWAFGLTVGIVAAQIAIPYRRYVKFLKYSCLALLAYVVIAFLPKVQVNWKEAAHQLLIPHWSASKDYILTVVGFLGTTISPYLFFWQAAQQVEEDIAKGEARAPGQRASSVKRSEIRAVRADTATGMIFSQIITVFIVITTSATLHASGKTDISSAEDAARALLPLGQSAYWLFTLGIVGSGLLAAPTLAGSVAYAVSETVGWRSGLFRRLTRARGFYATLGLVMVAGCLLNFVHTISPVKALLYSAVVNGLAAPPLIVLILLVANNRRIMGNHTNGWLSNTIGWIAVALMSLAGGLCIWGICTG